MISKSIAEIKALWKGKQNGQPDFLLLEMQEPLCIPILEMISDSYTSCGADSCTENNIFAFKLRYCEPDSSFDELYRYAYELEAAGGFHGKFKGIAVIDISEWCGNEKSVYFDAFIAYLFDHSEGLYYIFTSESDQSLNMEKMYSKLAEYFHIHRAEIDLYDEKILNPFVTAFFNDRNCLISADIIKEFCKTVRKSMKNHNSFRKVELLCEDLIKVNNKRINRTDFNRFMTMNSGFCITESIENNPLGITFLDERGK